MTALSPLATLWLDVFVNSFLPIVAFWVAGKINPFFFAFAGSLVGFLTLLPFVLKRAYFGLFFRREYLFPLFMIGFFGSALPIILLVSALEYTTPSNAAILSQAEVVYSMILSGIFLKEKITRKQLLGTALVLAGTVMIVLKERFTLRFTGDLIVLLMPISYQVSHLFSKKLKDHVSHVFVASARTFFAASSMFFIFFFYAFFTGFRPGFSPEVFLILLIWGVVLTALNNVLWYRAILNLDLAKSTAIILSYPVFTTLISFFLGMEKIQAYQLFGLFLALSGAMVVTFIVRPEKN